LEQKTKTYYKDGWKLLSATPLTGMRLDLITNDQVETLSFPGSAANTNCALRNLRRMLHRAEDWKLIRRAPKLKLEKEYGRLLTLDEETERKLIASAAASNCKKDIFERFRDVVILMRDTGMRNERELYRVRLENLDWKDRTIFVPDSKTEEGRRTVPMSERVYILLRARCGDRKTGWLFPAKRSKTGHLTTLAERFREAREKAGISPDMVLYCGRHDYGTRMMERTGNLKAVMKVMGHRDVKTAMKYQHPELEIVRAALDEGSKNREASA
jgi:integrase